MIRTPIAMMLALGWLAGAAGDARAQAFTDVTVEAQAGVLHTGLGITDNFIGTGAAWFDYDRDGDLDLYVTRRVGSNVMLANNGDGTFTNVTSALGVADMSHDGAGVSVADYDNDGWPDLYLANSDGDVLYRNDGGAGFTNVTQQAGLADPTAARGTSAAWGDYDRDGHLDLYVVNHVHIEGTAYDNVNRLYHNNGDGTFTKLPSGPISDADGYGFIGAWTDFDDDGDPDVFLVNDCLFGGSGTRLYRNDGGTDPLAWTFTDVAAQLGVAGCHNGMGIAIGDYDCDGRLDYFYTNIGAPLLLKYSGEAFDDLTAEAGMAEVRVPSTGQMRWTWGCNFFDYDLDGWLDLYVASGALRGRVEVDPQPNLLYRSDGNGSTFADVSATSGADDARRTRTSVVGDYDGDGDLDLYIVNYEAQTKLLRNDAAGDNHYLSVALEGVRSNRDGIGARVRVLTPDGRYQYFETHSGTSLGGGDQTGAHFGLGGNDRVSELLVRWPSGVVQALRDVAADRRVTVVEDWSEPVPRLMRLRVERDGRSAVLSWSTRYDDGIDRFEIQHSDGDEFAALGEVAAGGSSFRVDDYCFTSPALAPGRHEFRLRQIGGGESGTISEVVAVEVPGAREPTVSAAFPNPFRTETRVSVAPDDDDVVRAVVYDAEGRRVRVLRDRFVAGGETEPIAFRGDGLPSGVYWIVIQGGSFEARRKVVLIR